MGWVYRVCPACKGRGIIPTPDNSRWQVCPLCHGKGVVKRVVDEVEVYYLPRKTY